VGLCLFGQALDFYCVIFRELEAALLSVQRMLLACLAFWCGTFIFLTFNQKNWPLIGLLLVAIIVYFSGDVEDFKTSGAIILLAGVTLGRGVSFALTRGGENHAKCVNCRSVIVNFLVGLVTLLAFSACWRLNMAGNYHGPRWMGLWNNPNTYGMLMGAGLALAVGLLMRDRRLQMADGENEMQNPGREFAIGCRNRLLCVYASIKSAIGNWQSAILCVAAGMMAVGLFFSYSRGAWVGTLVGLLYLAKAHGKLKWRWVLSGIPVVTAAVCFFWHSTADTDLWYLKRLDFSRPSAQHRVVAWCGALQMIRDHPFGVGWDNAVDVYEKNYSPPENGAAAINMNDYLMLGTQLGIPGLLCFVTYVGMCFKSRPRLDKIRGVNADGEDKLACRAAALAMAMAFWFDGGLFTLATAAVFWILLENGACDSERKRQTRDTTNKAMLLYWW